MICGAALGVQFRSIKVRKKMFEAKINLETSEILCPTCNKSNFTIFRRDKPPQQNLWCRGKVSNRIYLNHCKCENCGQLFVYKVDKKNNPVLERDKDGA